MGRKSPCYALYKGDELIGIGTVAYLAKKQNVNEATIRFYATPTWRNRRKGSSKAIMAFRVEED